MSEETFDSAAVNSGSESPNPTIRGRREGHGASENEPEVASAKKKVVVVMGATGAGKSRLAIDLASHFAGVEIINADSMQVYRGLDVLTNKVPLSERKGVPHHLLGNIDSSSEFTSRDFRNLAIPIIDDVLARGCLPVIVGGTNYYIQALVSSYLVDDVAEDMAGGSENSLLGEIDLDSVDSYSAFELLKEIDPIAANRFHPNEHRKIRHYLSLYASSGVLPSKLFNGKAAEKWGRADNFRYSCCLIWVDASLPVLDEYVNTRVDCMIDAGLLNEVCDIYKPKSDYTRGLKQAIGVREFEEFFRVYFLNNEALNSSSLENVNINVPNSVNTNDMFSKPKLSEILHSKDRELWTLLVESINKLKANTRKLVRRQKRRLNRLKTFFSWNLQYIDVTRAFCDEAVDSWSALAVEPCAKIVRTFLLEVGPLTVAEAPDVHIQLLRSRDLCTPYVCEVCGNRVLRGAHEWEQHKIGRGHRKRVLRLKKQHLRSFSVDQQPHNCAKEPYQVSTTGNMILLLGSLQTKCLPPDL